MSDAWRGHAWSEAALGQVLFELARARRMPLCRHSLPRPPEAPLESDAARDAWLSRVALQLGLWLQAVHCGYPEIEASLRRAAPGLVCVACGGERLYLALLEVRGRFAVVLTPTLQQREIELARVHDALASPLEPSTEALVQGCLAGSAIRGRRRQRARRRLLELLLRERHVEGIWLLRAEPGSALWAQLVQRGVPGDAALALGCAASQLACVVFGWAVLGSMVLGGATDAGWMIAWALACCSAAVLQLGGAAFGERALHELVLLLKQRLMWGVLRADPDRLRRRGSGRLMALLGEADALENAALRGVVGVVFGLLQLLGSLLLGLWGSAGLLRAALLCIWCACLARWTLRLWHTRRRWTLGRLRLGRQLVENLAGNHTRIVQQPEARWHELEDQAVRDHVELSRQLDREQARLIVVPAGGWLILGSLALIPTLMQGPVTPTELGIALGTLWQAYVALTLLGKHVPSLAAAAVAWREVRDIHRAARRRSPAGHPNVARPQLSVASGAPGQALLEVRGLSFQHRASPVAVLRDCSLTLRAGERLLLEGRSGGGKSTLVSLLSGLRHAETGLILFHGLDRATLGGVTWSQLVAIAPQFHENHVLTGSLAFNLLLGRSWPASLEDRRDAMQACNELGLGPLLQRMPLGLNQLVGETGWQLSHGERSRIFLARALLQRPHVLLLDESFAALDAEAVRHCVSAISKLAGGVIVITHR